ncbi:hypothetical protein AVEN_107349-1 [Araneus ventricosus]|uniref:Uncharacterized protein n=1 Tax=Araneus ventricosus TaxID=182803 RepID=A0A4Y2RTP9_ARAVE|nr:hypothetical protein AVEN_107349-1 [Araneus ventricosus]
MVESAPTPFTWSGALVNVQLNFKKELLCRRVQIKRIEKVLDSPQGGMYMKRQISQRVPASLVAMVCVWNTATSMTERTSCGGGWAVADDGYHPHFPITIAASIIRGRLLCDSIIVPMAAQYSRKSWWRCLG